MSALSVKPLRYDPRKIDAWVAGQRAAGADRWALVQISGRNRTSNVQRFSAEQAAAPEFVRDAMASAQQDADDTAPGVTSTYALVASDAERSELGRYTWRATGRQGDVNDAGPEEDASIIGMVAQHMRHSEAMARLRTGVAVDVVESYRDLIADLRKENETKGARIAALEAKLDAGAVLHAELVEKKHERDAELLERRARHERIGKLLSGLLAFGPMLLRQRGVQTGFDAELAAFVQTLEPEQLPKIAAALTDAQGAALGSLLKKYVPEVPGDQPKPN